MDRLQKSPYHRRNSAEILNYLEELILVQSKEEGFLPISEQEGGYYDLLIDGNEAKQLVVPQEAVSAVIVVEADASSTSFQRVVRFKENGSDPTANSGFALGENDMYSIIGKQNLANFKVIGIENDKIHTLRGQFFKTRQFQLKDI